MLVGRGGGDDATGRYGNTLWKGVESLRLRVRRERTHADPANGRKCFGRPTTEPQHIHTKENTLIPPLYLRVLTWA